jgi:hypothetical protein
MSGPSKFNLFDYISEGETKEMTSSNVFSDLGERFSFSIPSGPPIVIRDNYFARPTSPPPSPTLQSAETDSRVAILIPDDDDFYLDRSDAVSPNIAVSDAAPLKDLQGAIDYPKECLLITPPDNTFLYTMPPPSTADTRHIWIQAHIPKRACIRDIEYLLLDWAYTYAHLEIVDRRVKYIAWPTSSGCVCQATWAAFLRWIICATPAGGPQAN